MCGRRRRGADTRQEDWKVLALHPRAPMRMEGIEVDGRDCAEVEMPVGFPPKPAKRKGRKNDDGSSRSETNPRDWRVQDEKRRGIFRLSTFRRQDQKWVSIGRAGELGKRAKEAKAAEIRLSYRPAPADAQITFGEVAESLVVYLRDTKGRSWRPSSLRSCTRCHFADWHDRGRIDLSERGRSEANEASAQIGTKVGQQLHRQLQGSLQLRSQAGLAGGFAGATRRAARRPRQGQAQLPNGRRP